MPLLPAEEIIKALSTGIWRSSALRSSALRFETASKRSIGHVALIIEMPILEAFGAVNICLNRGRNLTVRVPCSISR